MNSGDGPSETGIKVIQTFPDQFKNPTELLQRRSGGGVSSFYLSREISKQKFGLSPPLVAIFKQVASGLNREHLQHLTLREGGAESLNAVFDYDFKDLSELQGFCLQRGIKFGEDQLIFLLKAVAMAGASLEDFLLHHPNISRRGIKVALREVPPNSGNVLYGVRLSNPLANDAYLGETFSAYGALLEAVGEAGLADPSIWTSAGRKKLLSERTEMPGLATLRAAHEKARLRSKQGVFRLFLVVAALASETELISLEKESNASALRETAREMLSQAQCGPALKDMLGQVLLSDNLAAWPAFSDLRAHYFSLHRDEELPELDSSFVNVLADPRFLLKEDSSLRLDLRGLFEGKIAATASATPSAPVERRSPSPPVIQASAASPAQEYYQQGLLVRHSPRQSVDPSTPQPSAPQPPISNEQTPRSPDPISVSTSVVEIPPGPPAPSGQSAHKNLSSFIKDATSRGLQLPNTPSPRVSEPDPTPVPQESGRSGQLMSPHKEPQTLPHESRLLAPPSQTQKSIFESSDKAVSEESSKDPNHALTIGVEQRSSQQFVARDSPSFKDLPPSAQAQATGYPMPPVSTPPPVSIPMNLIPSSLTSEYPKPPVSTPAYPNPPPPSSSAYKPPAASTPAYIPPSSYLPPPTPTLNSAYLPPSLPPYSHSLGVGYNSFSGKGSSAYRSIDTPFYDTLASAMNQRGSLGARISSFQAKIKAMRGEGVAGRERWNEAREYSPASQPLREIRLSPSLAAIRRGGPELAAYEFPEAAIHHRIDKIEAKIEDLRAELAAHRAGLVPPGPNSGFQSHSIQRETSYRETPQLGYSFQRLDPPGPRSFSEAVFRPQTTYIQAQNQTQIPSSIIRRESPKARSGSSVDFSYGKPFIPPAQLPETREIFSHSSASRVAAPSMLAQLEGKFIGSTRPAEAGRDYPPETRSDYFRTPVNRTSLLEQTPISRPQIPQTSNAQFPAIRTASLSTPQNPREQRSKSPLARWEPKAKPLNSAQTQLL